MVPRSLFSSGSYLLMKNRRCFITKKIGSKLQNTLKKKTLAGLKMAFLTQIKTKMNRLVLTLLGLIWILSLLREKSDLQQIQQESTNEKVLDVDCMALVDSVTKN